jgi:glyoxylase-like metal-dependent hydrolase (beta-lactamase superfamily II)
VEARRLGSPIGAVFETHVQADHVSGLPAMVEAERRRISRPGRRSSSSMSRSRTVRWSSWGTRSCGRW